MHLPMQSRMPLRSRIHKSQDRKMCETRELSENGRWSVEYISLQNFL
ncbi:unnamed protein product [Larinioides sclopetarius]|uniref:Uncharacterized protein n=1 Tax=Larinioides sclopetarius TaxID=280406 RepID=A0AAV2BT48_9ARAC